MTNEEILQKALQKALNNGWLQLDGKVIKAKDIITSELDVVGDIRLRYIDTDRKLSSIDLNTPFNSVIFSHSFAKAFWKSDDVRGITEYPSDTYLNGYWITPRCLTCGKEFKKIDIPEIIFGHKNCPMAEDNDWKHHLQQMVLEENPIKYLEAFL